MRRNDENINQAHALSIYLNNLSNELELALIQFNEIMNNYEQRKMLETVGIRAREMVMKMLFNSLGNFDCDWNYDGVFGSSCYSSKC